MTAKLPKWLKLAPLSLVQKLRQNITYLEINTLQIQYSTIPYTYNSAYILYYMSTNARKQEGK